MSIALSDLVREEHRLQVQLEHTARCTDQLLERFYTQWKKLDAERQELEKQLTSTRSLTREKVRLAQLLTFPPELAQWASLVTPSACDDGSDPSLLVSFGTPQVNVHVEALVKGMLQGATAKERTLRHRGVSLTALIDESTGKLVSTRSRGGNRSQEASQFSDASGSPLAGVGLAGRSNRLHGHSGHHVGHIAPHARAPAATSQPLDRLSARGPITAEELTTFERALELLANQSSDSTLNTPRLEKMTQPFVLGDSSYIPYLQPYNEKTMDEKIRNRTHRYLRRFGSGEWNSSNSSVLASMTQLTLRLKRSALTEFVIFKAHGRGRVLCSARQHRAGDLLFLDLAVLSVLENVKDNLLPKDLEESYQRIASKKQLFDKFKAWDLRLVTMVFAYIAQLASSAPLARRMKRSLGTSFGTFSSGALAGGVGGSTNSVGSMTSSFFEKSELKKKVKDLCCPLQDVEPSQLNELCKLGEMIYRSLPEHYRKGEDDAEGNEKPGTAAADEAAKVCIDDVVRLMIQFQCNCLTHMSAAEGGSGGGGRSVPSASRHPTGRSLFYLLSMLEHSCTPNTVVTHPSHLVDPESGLVEAEVRALRATMPADRLSISYIPGYLPAAVAKKRLRENYMFECTCPRCNGAQLDHVRRFYYKESTVIFSLAPYGTGARWEATPIDVAASDTQHLPSTRQFTFEHEVVIQAVSHESEIELQNKLPAALATIADDGADFSEDERRIALQGALETELSRLEGLLDIIAPLCPANCKLPTGLEEMKREVKVGDGSATQQRVPAASHHIIALSVLFLLRSVDAWLARSDVVSSPAKLELVRRVQRLVVTHLALMGADLGFTRLDQLNTLHSTKEGSEAKASATPQIRCDVEERSHHLGFYTNYWELLGSISCRCLGEGDSKQQADELSIATASWNLVFDLLGGLLQWSGTSRCVRAQIFAADPKRFAVHPHSHSGEEASGHSERPSLFYLPTIL